MSAFEAPTPMGFSCPGPGETASGKSWRVRDGAPADTLALKAKLEIPETLAAMLSGRGVGLEEADSYLNPSLRTLMPDPYVMTDMEAGANRLAQAVMSGQVIGVFGDYDVDGVSSSAILQTFFDDIGAKACAHLPDRFTEGYGPSREGFDALIKEGASVIVTVDCGTSAGELIERARACGVDVVVFDHHQVDPSLSLKALATINPQRTDDMSGLTTLSAAGVTFMGVVAINRILRDAGWYASRREPDLRRWLDLVALGLVCDVMEMRDLTKAFVRTGLKVLQRGGNQGLRVLADLCGVGKIPTEYDLGFALGPRINAAGRIGHARLAFELFTTHSEPDRMRLAQKLNDLNEVRKTVEAAALEDAVRQISTQKLDDWPVIVVAEQGWHPGVVGIIAGRLKDRYSKPAFAIALDGETGTGSGRSVNGFDIGSVIRALAETGEVIRGGGHAMAAGLTVSADQLEPLRASLAKAFIEQSKAVPETIDLDGVVSAEAISGDFAALLGRAGPFGVGNPEPIFAINAVRATGIKIVGENHLAVTFEDAVGVRRRGIAFRAADGPMHAMMKGDSPLHLAGRIQKDNWRGGGAGQLQIVDAAPAR